MFRIVFITLLLNLFSSLPLSAQPCMSMHVVLNTAAGYTDEAGDISGFHFDYLSALEEISGLCMDKKLLPYPRAKRNIEMGVHDGGILARSTDLDNEVEYVSKLLISKLVVLPRKGLSLNNYQDLSNIKIARVRKLNLGDVLDNDPNLVFVEVSDYEQGLQLLNRGRVDAIAGNALGLSTAIEKLNMFAEINALQKLTISEREVWFVLSKKSKNLNKIDQLKEAAQIIINRGVLDTILKKYFGENWKLVD